MTACVIPIREAQATPEPCAEMVASILAERAAVMLMCAATQMVGWRAEIIRAAAHGDRGRVVAALREWRA